MCLTLNSGIYLYTPYRILTLLVMPHIAIRNNQYDSNSADEGVNFVNNIVRLYFFKLIMQKQCIHS